MKISRLKKFFFTIILLSIIVIGGGVTFVYLNKDEILQSALEKINEHLTAKVDVNSINLSAFEEWPRVAIILGGVSIKNNHEFKHQLIQSDEVIVGFDMLALLRGEYTIEQVSLKDADINIEFNKAGKANYWIFHPRDTTAEKKSIGLKLLTIDNSNISYYDYRGSMSKEVHLSTESSTANVEFSGDYLFLDINSDNNLHQIKWSGTQFINDFSNQIEIGLNYDLVTKNLQLRQGVLKSQILSLSGINGEIGLGESSNLKINCGSKFFNIFELSEQLPNTVKKNLLKFGVTGDMKLDLELSGDYAESSKMKTALNFEIKELNAIDPKRKLHFSSLNGTGTYQNSKGFEFKRGQITNLKLEGQLEEAEFKTQFSTLELNLKSYSGKAEGILNEKSFTSLYPGEEIKTFDGLIDYEIEIQKKDEELLWDGEMDLKSVSFQNSFISHEIKNLNGVLLFNNDELALQSVTGLIGNSDFDISGLIINPLNIINTDKGPFYLSGEYKGKTLDLDNLLLKTTSGETNQNTQIIRNYTIPQNVNIGLDLTVDHLKYKKFRASSAYANVSIKNQTLEAKEVKFNSIDGEVAGELVINTAGELIHCTSTSTIKSLAIDSIFYVFDNFDQDFIEDRHLSGKITADIKSDFHLSKNLTPIYQTINAQINTSVLNGELIEFEPMYRLSRFVDENELAHLRFEELNNSITISDSKILIPDMSIRSNVSNISLSGWHTFDQRIDYHLKVPLKKAYKKDRDERFGAIENNEDNLTNIFLKITGTTDDYKIAYDQKSALINVKQQIVNEGKELIQSIKTKGKSAATTTTVQLDTTEYFDFDDDIFETDSLENQY